MILLASLPVHQLIKILRKEEFALLSYLITGSIVFISVENSQIFILFSLTTHRCLNRAMRMTSDWSQCPFNIHSSFFKYLLNFWHHKTRQFCFCFCSFFASDVQSAISPRNLCSLYWKMVFKSKDLVSGVSPATEVSFPLGSLCRKGLGNTSLYSHTYTHT